MEQLKPHITAIANQYNHSYELVHEMVVNTIEMNTAFQNDDYDVFGITFPKFKAYAEQYGETGLISAISDMLSKEYYTRYPVNKK